MATPFVIGAYAALPAERAQQEEFYGSLAQAAWVNGLEIPLRATITDDLPWFAQQIAPSFTTNVLTPIPGTMGKLGKNPAFGIASPDEAGRALALEFLIDAVNQVKAVNDAVGRQVFTHIALHTAPTATAQREALVRSLATIEQWDADGAKFVIEHQDAFIPEQAPQKGFLSLADEIIAIEEADAERTFISLNWGRSAIEGRGTELPLEHVKQAAASGKLEGLIFSGAHDVDGDYGPAWTDAHVALHQDEPSSIMTSSLVASAAQAATAAKVQYLGAKLTLDGRYSVAERVAILQRVAAAAGQPNA
ncbi:hypothetical protein J2S49_000901 [Arcanobacterium wilhelmae]|uniref:DUF4862 domain-containing protein n=1 Tax=Arcanobacterium wilhelmae TaxID=1803177 RepID=A0ABT9NAS4_9ACTO|nr:DUF4862 family protein [Arcanobacterium wilhelmae]MDP9800825.1 hypothetical protein [Arcanobacterium wilhelmae]WFN90200.1 DUF4862 family protein [Arcanobacterium wilhelmae]